MPKKKKAEQTNDVAETAMTQAVMLPPDGGEGPVTEHGDDMLSPFDSHAMTEAEQLTKPMAEAAKTPGAPAYAADPYPMMTVNLCGYSGGPAMHLLRSHRFKQIQIRFDHGQPEERYLTMLKRAGWIDRTESEGVWTSQIDPDARWQSVDRMEKEFKSIANAIRKDKGLEPVLQPLALA